MVSDDIGLKLHHRATVGEHLTPEEQLQLDAWYTAQDQAEAAMWTLGNPPLIDLEMLQSQVDQTLTQLETSVQQIQRITQENSKLRQENANLAKQLTIRHSA